MKIVSCSQCNQVFQKKQTDVIENKRVCHGCKKLVERSRKEMGSVKVWQMTEEERQAYIQKHPIIPSKRPKKEAFADLDKLVRTKKGDDDGR